MTLWSTCSFCHKCGRSKADERAERAEKKGKGKGAPTSPNKGIGGNSPQQHQPKSPQQQQPDKAADSPPPKFASAKVAQWHVKKPVDQAVDKPADDQIEVAHSEAQADPKLAMLREEEAHLEALFAALRSSDNPRSIGASIQHAKELLDVQHAITDLKPAREKIDKLAGALTRKIAARESLQSSIDQSIDALHEANNAVVKAQEKYQENEEQIVIVDLKLVNAKQLQANEQAAAMANNTDPLGVVVARLTALDAAGVVTDPNMQLIFQNLSQAITACMQNQQLQANLKPHSAPVASDTPRQTPESSRAPAGLAPSQQTEPQPDQSQQVPATEIDPSQVSQHHQAAEAVLEGVPTGPAAVPATFQQAPPAVMIGLDQPLGPDTSN